ncbi:DUF244 domain-containing protein [Candidatus Parcubacteria bacterium]|nr:DUF244 domain-containing protein [Candidatus Parcubacteria bacterium]
MILSMGLIAMVAVGTAFQPTEEETVTIEGKVMIAEVEEGVIYENLNELDFVELSEGVVIRADIYHSELDFRDWFDNYPTQVNCSTILTLVGKNGKYSIEFPCDPNRNYQIHYNLYVDPDWLQPIEEICRTTWTTEIPAGYTYTNNTIEGPDFYLLIWG